MDYATLQDLYFHELKDLYHAEKQLLRSLPGVIRHTSSTPLRHALEAHLVETQGQVERLCHLFERHGKFIRGAKCRGMEGLLEATRCWLQAEAGCAVLDAGILSAIRQVEQYEMAGYGCAQTHARLLGFGEDEMLLTRTLREEEAAARTLASLCEGVNLRAHMPRAA